MQKKILVTGSSGLIGAALVKRFKQNGVEVVGIDYRPAETTNVVSRLESTSLNTQLIGPYSGVVHLAGVTRVLWGQRDPASCWSQNVENTLALIDATRQMRRPPWIIYASSREVYGKARLLPILDDAPVAPINVYGCSKAASEMLMRQAIDGGLPGAVVRFSTVYGGTNDHPDRVIPAFMRAAIDRAPITIFGEDVGLDPTWIDDVINGLVQLTAALDADRIPSRPILFSGGTLVRLVDLVDIIKRSLKTNIEILIAPPRTYDVKQFAGIPRYAEEFLQWQLSTPIDEGIKLYARKLGAKVAA